MSPGVFSTEVVINAVAFSAVRAVKSETKFGIEPYPGT